MELFDAQFNIASLLTVVSYLVVLTGLLIDIHSVYREVEMHREERKHLDAIKTEFISLASHQLRTPLTSVRWTLGFLRDGEAGELSKEQKEVVQSGLKDARRMADVIYTLLQISRLDAGEIQTFVHHVTLYDLIEKSCEAYEGKYNRAGQKITIICPKELALITDPDILREVLDNLISNAVKYTPSKGSISIRAKEEEDGVMIQVTDSGFGIPKDQQNRLFTKFFRASNAVKKGCSGTGLGLYMVNALVQLLGGGITFTSQEDKGSTFTVSLPSLL